MREEEFAKKLALRAGEIMRSHFKIGVEHDIKEDKTRVTAADTHINAMVIEEIDKFFPLDNVIGEEASNIKSGLRSWVLDPIDGTDPFARGVPTNVFSLALTEGGVPIVGVVYDPYMDRMYSAIKGEGAYLNGEKISTSKKIDLDHCAIEYGGLKRLKNLQFLEAMRESEANVYAYKCTVYAQMMVATGQLEGAIYLFNKPWDAAASKIIVEEAGGITSDVHGEDQRYDQEIKGYVSSGNAEFHKSLLAALRPSV